MELELNDSAASFENTVFNVTQSCNTAAGVIYLSRSDTPGQVLFTWAGENPTPSTISSRSMSTMRCFLSRVMSVASSNANDRTLKNSRVSKLSNMRRCGYAGSVLAGCDVCRAVMQFSTSSFTCATFSSAIRPDGYA